MVRRSPWIDVHRVGRERRGEIEALSFDRLPSFPEARPASGHEVVVGLRPEHLAVANGNVAESDATLPAIVDVVEYLGDEQLVHLSVRDVSILAKLPVEHHVAPGDELTVSIPRDKIHLFDAETGERVNV